MGFDNHSSSESDEDSNVRHDRFKSERFQKGSSESSSRREERFNKRSDVHRGSRHHRERSPRASHRDRGIVSSSSSSFHRNRSKYETRSDHDRKDRDKNSYSRSSQSEKNSSKHSGGFEKEDPGIKIKKNLSSLLKSFDKQVESKRSTSENSGQPSKEIGPALPTHLKEKFDPANDSDQEKPPEDPVVNSALLVPTGSNTQSDEIKPDLEPRNFGDEVRLQKTTPVDSLDKENKDYVSFAEGPVLPPHFQTSLKEDHPSSVDSQETTSTFSSSLNNLASTESTPDTSNLPSKSEAEAYGPALPPKVESGAYGPALPPKAGSFGPTLPLGLKIHVHEDHSAGSRVEESEESEEDEDMVGPLPEGKMNITQYQLDLRAASIKRKLEEEKNGSSNDLKKREEWMLELPPEKASNLGLGPRSFRKREGPDMSNRSDWTDTPADRLRKAELAKSGIVVEPVNSEEMMKSAFVKERNEVMDKISQQSREDDRPKSLLELHQKKIKKKKKKDEKDGKKKERRPFDRNVDLQVNRFDDAQKKAIYKKAQLLDTRFSTGESKYL